MNENPTNAQEQFELGKNYDPSLGYGEEDGEKKACYWYTKAAKQGHADAQNNLGSLFYNAKGVSENRTKAKYWYKKAAKQGHKMAERNLNRLDFHDSKMIVLSIIGAIIGLIFFSSIIEYLFGNSLLSYIVSIGGAIAGWIIGKKIRAVVLSIGTILSIGALVLGTIILFANKNYVKNDNAARKQVLRVSDVSTVNPSLDGKLIYAHAFADTQDVLSDDLFGASEKAVALVRMVEYYQYEERSRTEKKDKLGGSEETITTYTYEKKWVTSPINSGGFADPDYKKSNIVLENDVKAQLQYAKNVTFGAYKLPGFIIESIRGNVSVEPKISNSDLAQWNNRIAKRARDVGYKADGNATLAHVQGNVVYFGKSPSSPQIGDVRITLAKVPPADISIIARVIGPTFEKYLAPNGKTFTSVAMGTVSAKTMLENPRKYAVLLRLIIGILLVVGGALKMVFTRLRFKEPA